MIKSVLGDATKQGTKVLAHQTNCIGVMGAGIARQIKMQLMTVEDFNQYKNLCKWKGATLLGKVQFLNLENCILANVFGENVPTGRKLDTDYNALRTGLITVHNYCKENNYDVTIPGLMGCGLAGGDWDYVLNQIIKPIFGDSEVQLTIAYFEEENFNKYA